MSGRKLLFFITEDYYVVSHRLALARAAHEAGYEVGVITRVRESGEAIRAAGVRLIPFENERSRLNPFHELVTLARLVALYRREQPDIVHHVAMKPIIYGTIAARLATRARIVNAVAGMGWMFTSAAGHARALTAGVRQALRWALTQGIALVQNRDDERLLMAFGVPADRIRRIAGCGVDIGAFARERTVRPVPTVLFPARLLWDKGIGEFVAAARLLRERQVPARFVAAGAPDPLNPASVPPAQLAAWQQEGLIEFRGWVADMPALLAETDLVCLPSYREGLPKSLLEAAAAGVAAVTTDVPGCREVVDDGQTGLLVPAGEVAPLADALEQLLRDRERREQFGRRARQRAESEIDVQTFLERSLALYAEAL